MKQEAINLYTQLNAEWNKKPQNLEKCVEILNHLKVETFFLINHISYFKLINL